MNNSLPSWGRMAEYDSNDMGKLSMNHGDFSLFPDYGVTVVPNSWFETSASSHSGAPEGDHVQDIFKVLPDVQAPAQGSSSVESMMEFLLEPEEGEMKADEKDILKCQSHGIAGVSREPKGKQEYVQNKRIRSAEEHNKSERMRRDRINMKMKTLQELIPNCNKTDRASMLDDAIEYLKALKLQVHMMSVGGSALCQAPYLSPTSIQTVQVPNFSPFLQMRPGLGFGVGGVGMGMAGICYNPSFPMMSIPSASLHPSPPPSSGVPVMSNCADPSAPQFQVPFFPSQPLPTTGAMPVNVMQPIITPAFCHPNQGESASRSIPSVMTDSHQVPIVPQSCRSPRFPSPVRMQRTDRS